MSILYVLGIDPGVTTGYAAWVCKGQALTVVTSGTAYTIERKVLEMKDLYGADAILVRVEDARLRTWFGKTSTEVWKGAGSVMRDCQRWEEFLSAEDIPFELVSPKNNSTKLKAIPFQRYTGYEGSTNEHARDAGMLVYQYNINFYQAKAERCVRV